MNNSINYAEIYTKVLEFSSEILKKHGKDALGYAVDRIDEILSNAPKEQ